MVRELLYLAAIPICAAHFYHQFSELNYQWSCHGSTLGQRSSLLENSLFALKNIALSVEVTSATAQISTGLLWGVFQMQEKWVSFHEYHKTLFTFLGVVR